MHMYIHELCTYVRCVLNIYKDLDDDHDDSYTQLRSCHLFIHLQESLYFNIMQVNATVRLKFCTADFEYKLIIISFRFVSPLPNENDASVHLYFVFALN